MAVTPERKAELIAALEELIGPRPMPKPKVVITKLGSDEVTGSPSGLICGRSRCVRRGRNVSDDGH